MNYRKHVPDWCHVLLCAEHQGQGWSLAPPPPSNSTAHLVSVICLDNYHLLQHHPHLSSSQHIASNGPVLGTEPLACVTWLILCHPSHTFLSSLLCLLRHREHKQVAQGYTALSGSLKGQAGMMAQSREARRQPGRSWIMPQAQATEDTTIKTQSLPQSPRPRLTFDQDARCLSTLCPTWYHKHPPPKIGKEVSVWVGMGHMVTSQTRGQLGKWESDRFHSGLGSLPHEHWFGEEFPNVGVFILFGFRTMRQFKNYWGIGSWGIQNFLLR